MSQFRCPRFRRLRVRCVRAARGGGTGTRAGWGGTAESRRSDSSWQETEIMDETVFDALTRSVVTEAGPRRAVVRLLAGTVLGAIASRLAPLEEATAKARSHRGKARRPHQKKDRGLQSEGKRKGKRKGKGHQAPPQSPPPLPPLPPGC